MPVTTSYLRDAPGAGNLPPTSFAFDVELWSLIAIFLGLAALDHFIVAAPRINQWYNRNLALGINYARWYEYSLSASIMIVAIALLSGIFDLLTLILMFSINAVMILCGLLMESRNMGEKRRRHPDWAPFIVGCLAGIVPWIVIGTNYLGAETVTGGQVPNFVIAIEVSLFILFNSFAINMVLQYKRIGPWKDYIFGEKGFIVLSLTAKSALAWQIFAGTLMD